MLEFDAGRPPWNSHGVWLFVDHRLEIENLKDPFEGDQCARDVHIDVGESSKRSV